MNIFVDTREKQRAIKKIVAEFEKQGVGYASTKLFVGDYQRADNSLLVIDRKQNLLEVCTNVGQDRERFVRELKRAREMGVKIIFLVEHGKDVNSLEEVKKWQNPRLKDSPLALSGERLYKILSVLEKNYGCEFQFCTKNETGTRIIQLLGGE
ncbi:MAG: ERCC4 domain-containing protein [Clostridia bacterium]|nr:ERCC4 domain-containing protein [Clostridia bacterium]